MNLQNGYKTLYENVGTDSNDAKVRIFKASKTGINKNCDTITEIALDTYKLVYEKNGKIYGSTTGVPAAGDAEFTDFGLVFEDGYKAPEEEETDPEVDNEPEIEDDTPENTGEDLSGNTEE